MCDGKQHRREAHTREPLNTANTAAPCDMCYENAATLWCEACDDLICEACDALRHKNPKRANHRRTRWVTGEVRHVRTVTLEEIQAQAAAARTTTGEHSSSQSQPSWDDGGSDLSSDSDSATERGYKGKGKEPAVVIPRLSLNLLGGQPPLQAGQVLWQHVVNVLCIAAVIVDGEVTASVVPFNLKLGGSHCPIQKRQ